MSYVQFTEQDRQAMLAAIGVPNVEALFKDIPDPLRVKGLLKLPRPLSEPELLADLNRLAAQNRSAAESPCFMGCGAYDHFIPTVVDALYAQNGFLTGYTPYQAEASQGSLQLLFEFQTMVCELTGMDISNASLYEMSTSLVEAFMLARSATRRPNAVIAGGVHPDGVQVLRTYMASEPFEDHHLPIGDGRINLDLLKRTVDENVAAVIVQSPNFFGQIEQLDKVAEIAKAAGALLIVITDPISCGLLKRPGDYGADVVVAEGQPLGIPLLYGGPYLGLLAVKQEHLRKVPGRLIGQTTDSEGRRGFCLTLQAREQHIRREKATSNICTNQGLLATRATIYMTAMGKHGIRTVAEHCLRKAHYAAEQIAALPGFALKFTGPFFKEFVVRSEKKPVADVLNHVRRQGLLGGVALGGWHQELQDCFAVAVTEKRTKDEIDQLVSALKSA